MNKEQLTVVGLVAFAAGNAVGYFRNRKHIKMLVSNATDFAVLAVQNDKENDYLRYLLDEHEVEPTEFDRIVINAIRQDH